MRKPKLKGAAKAAAERRAAAGLPPRKKPKQHRPKAVTATVALGPVDPTRFYHRKLVETIFGIKRTKLNDLVNGGIFPPWGSCGNGRRDKGYVGQTILDIQSDIIAKSKKEDAR